MSTELFPGREVENDLKDDPRWQLVSRIASSAIFLKAIRLRLLLLHMTERTLHGHIEDLTEHQIGRDVFQKPEGYTTLEDSSVRVYVRQLRLKLHEYFDSGGSREPLIVEIPKGSYIPIFREIEVASSDSLAEPPAPTPIPIEQARVRSPMLPWLLSLVLACVCITLAVVLVRSNRRARTVPWPISLIFDGTHQTHIVVADINYDLLRVRRGQTSSLDEYLRRGEGQDVDLDQMDPSDARLLSYIEGSTLTSFADVMAATTFSDLAMQYHQNVRVQPARDLQLRDLENGNYIFVGSPNSNPWVSLFQPKLNFVENEEPLEKQGNYFINQKPRPGEQKTYKGFPFYQSAGEDYADIAFLPGPTNQGSVLILQGLHQEGTEAAARFLGDRSNYASLKRALNVTSGSAPRYFEVLIKTQVIAGTPETTSIVAARIIGR